MNKEKFLDKFYKQLDFLDSITIKKYLDIYEEKINKSLDRGLTEKEAVQRLGKIKIIINNIKNEVGNDEITEKDIKDSYSTSHVDTTTNNTNFKKFLLIVIGFIFLSISIYNIVVLFNITKFKNIPSILCSTGIIILTICISFMLIINIIRNKPYVSYLNLLKSKINLIGIATMFIGLLLITASFVIGECKVDNMINFGNHREEEYEFYIDKNIQLYINDEVNFFFSDEIITPVIKVYANDDVSFELIEGNENYTLKQTGSRTNLFFIKKHSIDIYVPIGNFAETEVYIEGDNINATIEKVHFKKLTIKANDIDINNNEVIIDYLSINSNNLNIELAKGSILHKSYITVKNICEVYFDETITDNINIEAKELTINIYNTILSKLFLTATNLVVDFDGNICEYLSVLSSTIIMECRESIIDYQYYGVESGRITADLFGLKESYTFKIKTNGETNVTTGGTGDLYFELESKDVNLKVKY